MNKPLSPAAQAVDFAVYGPSPDATLRQIAAAALRAMANHWRIDTEFIDGVEYIRTTTLDSIAAELEGADG